MRTYFWDFKRDDGFPITVEYSFAGGSPTTYSPRFGAEGGDPCEVSIVAAWPDSSRYDRLYGIRNHLDWDRFPWWKQPLRLLGLYVIEAVLWLMARRAQPNDAERERIEAYITENFKEEPFDED